MILVIAEEQNGRLNRASLEVIAAAQSMSTRVTAVLVGCASDDAARDLAQIDLADTICLDHDALATYTPDGFVAALDPLVRTSPATHVLFAHTYQTRDFAPRLAARLTRPLVSDCTGLRQVDGVWHFTRSLFHGRLAADVVAAGPLPHLVTFRIGSFRADDARRAASPLPVRRIPVEIHAADIRQVPETPARETNQTVDLSKAARIVSVGRGIKDERHVALAQQLAAALGAELAASRPLCDSGWVPMERQVGSSGQTVAPQLYLALGISGAIQHIVGMKGSKIIVAVNTDPDAPIFEVATYGIVGDLFDVVPAMIAALGEG